jgi:MATE family multidrug resistance protein
VNGGNRPSLCRHAADLLRLAAPVIVARAGQITMALVDALMVGRFSAQELAWLGLGSTPNHVMVTTGVGLLIGTVVLTSHAVGAGTPEECGQVWRRSVPYALLIGSIGAVICLKGEALLLLFGQAPDLAAGGGRVLAVLGAGLPGITLFTTCAFFLEGLKRPLPGMVVMIAANLVNVVLNYVLVWGAFGLPALGAVGSAWATTGVRWLMALGLLLYVWNLRDRDRLAIRKRQEGWWRQGDRQRRIGFAAGSSMGLESAAFATLGLFAGLLGPLALGAHTVALTLLALPFMAAVGLGGATAVQVGTAYGEGNRADLVLAGWTGLGVTSIILAAVACLFAIFPGAIARMFTANAELQQVTAPVVAFSSLILVADGGQVVMGNALRGRGDTWIPTALHFFSYFGVMIPAAALFGLYLGRGVLGLFEGVLIASIVSVTVLSVRFHILSRR